MEPPSSSNAPTDPTCIKDRGCARVCVCRCVCVCVCRGACAYLCVLVWATREYIAPYCENSPTSPITELLETNSSPFQDSSPSLRLFAPPGEQEEGCAQREPCSPSVWNESPVPRGEWQATDRRPTLTHRAYSRHHHHFVPRPPGLQSLKPNSLCTHVHMWTHTPTHTQSGSPSIHTLKCHSTKWMKTNAEKNIQMCFWTVGTS